MKRYLKINTGYLREINIYNEEKLAFSSQEENQQVIMVKYNQVYIKKNKLGKGDLMEDKIQLTEEQEIYKNRIKKLIDVVRLKVSKHNLDDEYDAVLAEIGEIAHQLVISLENKPVFTESVLIGAGELTPNDREFYSHIHVIEDLLDYLEEYSSN